MYGFPLVIKNVLISNTFRKTLFLAVLPVTPPHNPRPVVAAPTHHFYRELVYREAAKWQENTFS